MQSGGKRGKYFTENFKSLFKSSRLKKCHQKCLTANKTDEIYRTVFKKIYYFQLATQLKEFFDIITVLAKAVVGGGGGGAGGTVAPPFASKR